MQILESALLDSSTMSWVGRDASAAQTTHLPSGESAPPFTKHPYSEWTTPLPA